MSTHCVPTIISVSIVFVTGIYYLLLYLVLPADRTNRTFSSLCFSVAFYNITCAGLYNSTSTVEGMFWQIGNFVGIAVIAVCFLRFVMELTERKNKTILRLTSTFYLICLSINLFHSGELTFTLNKPAVKRIVIGNLLDITYYEVELGLVPLVQLGGTIAALVYALFLLFSHQRQRRDPNYTPTLIAISCFFVAFLNDVFVVTGAYQFIYLTEYGFLVIVFMMLYLLLKQFGRTQQQVEDLNLQLKETNTTLAETYLQLRRESELLTATMSSIGDAVIVTDYKGIIVLANETARAITGSDNLVGLSADRALMLRDEDNTKHIEVTQQFAQKLSPSEKMTLVLTLQTQTRGDLIVSLCMTPVTMGNDAVFGTVFVFRDITFEREKEKEIIMADKMESLAVLANTIAHDCKNFLLSIQGVLSLIDKKLPHNPLGAKLLVETGDDAIARASEMVDQLMDFTGVRQMTKRPRDVACVVQRAANLALKDSNVHLKLDTESTPVIALIDESQITQAVHNIVLNARQAMNKGGFVTIHIRSVQFGDRNSSYINAGPYVKISISDSGHGIPKEYLKKIFNPYFTTKQSGTGLGLASVYSIVKQHHGTIRVSSEYLKGTRFDILLPLGESHSDCLVNSTGSTSSLSA